MLRGWRSWLPMSWVAYRAWKYGALVLMRNFMGKRQIQAAALEAGEAHYRFRWHMTRKSEALCCPLAGGAEAARRPSRFCACFIASACCSVRREISGRSALFFFSSAGLPPAGGARLPFSFDALLPVGPGCRFLSWFYWWHALRDGRRDTVDGFSGCKRRIYNSGYRDIDR